MVCYGKIWPEMSVVKGLHDDDGTKDHTATNTAEACNGENKATMSVHDFNSIPSPRILKTHAPRKLFLANDGDNPDPTSNGINADAKVIYVTRNPFDACVSCYYHPKPGISPESTGCRFDGFAKLWLSDSIEFGGWSNHVREWREQYRRCQATNSNQMLWVSYEELVTDPRTSITKIANFLNVGVDSNLIDLVMEGCKFDNMKNTAHSALEAGTKGDSTHLRKGKIGDWRNHFTDKLKAEFEAVLIKEFPDGLDVTYDIGDGETWTIQGASHSKLWKERVSSFLNGATFATWHSNQPDC